VIRLADHLSPARTVDLASRSKDAALMELVETLSSAPEVSDRDRLLQAVLEREKIVSTGIGLGVAVPHAKISEVAEFVVAYGRSKQGIDFGSIDDRPVHHVVLIVGPPDRQQRYLQFLATVTLKLKQGDLRKALEEAPDAAALYQVLAKA
jgi:mannitol/fructose-specific phosphotransferase system IIA component (Ntr-type)